MVKTGAETGKVKRLRRTSRVIVAPCTARGRITGEPVEAVAGFLSGKDGARAEVLLLRKYGVVARVYYVILAIWLRLARKPRLRPVYLQIAPRQSGLRALFARR